MDKIKILPDIEPTDTIFLDLVKELMLSSFIAVLYSALNLRLVSQKFLKRILTRSWTTLWI